METKIGNSPSFIWRSIAATRNVISSGSNWKIGTGNDISILRQPWLNNTTDPFVYTTSPALENQMVSSLFQTGTKEWDLDLLNDNFDDRDKQYIINTKVEHELESDIL